jgi:hypothetical protein
VLSIPGLLEILEQVGPQSRLFRHARAVLDSHICPVPADGIKASPAGPERILSIAMATFDDYDGVYFTAQSIRLYHPEITAQSEILVLDNHPDGPAAAALKQLDSCVAGYRYVPYGGHRGTAVRDLLFREANAQWVLCVDSHVQFAPGSLARLVEFLGEHGDSVDLWQGPLLNDNLYSVSSHLDPVWSAGMYGQWREDPRAADPNGEPFEIDMQGLGVFACRKSAWPGFNPRMSGFGGEEGYIHEKIRRQGGRVYCLPFLRWMHRFNRPLGIPYRPAWPERVRNYLIGFEELGLSPAPVEEHFRTLLGAEASEPMFHSARMELGGPFHHFDAIYSIRRDDSAERWRDLHLERKVRFLPARETALSSEIGRIAAHRRVLQEAAWQGLANVLVCEQDFEPCEASLGACEVLVGSLRRAPWLVRRLAGAVAYHSGAFERALVELPDGPSVSALWLRKGNTFEAVLTRLEQAGEADRVFEGGFSVTIFGSRITVIADRAEAGAYLHRYLLPCLPRSAPAAGSSDLEFRVVGGASDGEFELSQDGEQIGSGLPVAGIFERVQNAIDERLRKRGPGVAVHAGVVGWNGAAILIAGPSRAGKTTLVKELLKRGAVYFSDEYAFLDESGWVHAYPRALLLRDGTGSRSPALPSEWNARVASSPAPVGLVAVLRVEPGQPWRVTRIPQSEALVALLGNTPCEMGESPGLVSRLGTAIRSAACYAGVRGEADEAADRILQLMTELA